MDCKELRIKNVESGKRSEEKRVTNNFFSIFIYIFEKCVQWRERERDDGEQQNLLDSLFSLQTRVFLGVNHSFFASLTLPNFFYVFGD